jgi:tetratricopeptide (TPR) repeat protein
MGQNSCLFCAVVGHWIFPMRFLSASSALLCLALLAAPALAEKGDPEPAKPVEQPAKPVEPLRAQRADRTQALDRLFDALKVAPDEESAKYIENRIWAIWLTSTSDTANLLMGRVKAAVEAKDFDLAIKLLNAIIDIKPDYVEAWNRRATIFYTQKDLGRALADIQAVLAREPRHFGALSGLGIILQDIGDDKHALEVYRRALAIHPHIERVPDLIKKLTEKLEGRDI